MSEGPHIYRAMIAVKKKLSAMGLSKGRSAPKEAGGFRFRGIDDLYNTLCGVEAEEGVLVFPRVTSERVEYQTNKHGNLQTHVHLTMELKFVSCADGSSDIASAIGEGLDTSDKASGKAQSNAMKQAHLEVYKIPTEGLSDDIESHAEQVGQNLEKQLEASVAWGAWEAAQIKGLRAASTPGALLSVWTAVHAAVKDKAPEATVKRLTAVKDEMKAKLGNGHASAEAR